MTVKEISKSSFYKNSELLAEDLLYCKTSIGGYLQEKDAEDMLAETQKLIANNQRALLALDISQIAGASLNFRHRFTEIDIKDNQIACAIIVENHPSYLVGSFMIGINRPVFPVKIFFNSNKAIEWLQLFRR